MRRLASRSAAIRGRAFAPVVVASLACFACKDAAPSPAGRADLGGQAAEAGSGGAGSDGHHAAGMGGRGAALAGEVKAGSGGGAAGQAGKNSAELNITRGDVPPQPYPSIDVAAYAGLITKLNQFGLELGRRHAEANKLTDKNYVYSPLSASVALSMTYAGARGTTADEFKNLLSTDLEAGAFHTGMNRLVRELAARELSQADNGATSRIELAIADAVYVDATLNLQPAFLDVLSEHYDSGVHREDFRGASEAARIRINDWVALETRDKIKDLLPLGSIDEQTHLVLVNALYFYGNWRDPFPKLSTADAEFHKLEDTTVTASTMHRQGTWLYTQGSDFVAVDLPYVGDYLGMFLVLPNEGKFDQLRKAVSAEWLSAALEAGTNTTVNLSVPKFKMTVGTFSVKQSLEDMGLVTAFTDSADFSGISTDEPLHVADVLQKAFISLDESGTEAAAATAVIIAGSSAPAPVNVIQLNFDRPFLFFLHDENGAALFCGHVVDPSQD